MVPWSVVAGSLPLRLEVAVINIPRRRAVCTELGISPAFLNFLVHPINSSFRYPGGTKSRSPQAWSKNAPGVNPAREHTHTA
ncbi:MAG: hypothetical protein MSQ05_01880 [Akkermansia sp.]|nr:hypothetical protein [Akkermansia sp.]